MPRSNQQSKALHLMFEMLADEMNEAGLTHGKVIKADIPWNKTTVKELLFRPLMQAQYGKKSTTELTTQEIDGLIDTLTKTLGELGLSVIFPSISTLIDEQRHETQ